MFTKNRIWKTLLAVVLIATLAFSSLSSAQAQGGPPPMFGDAGDARPTTDAPNASYMARSRFVSVNIGMLFDASGKQLTEAGPAVPVQVLGLSDAPNAGDDLLVVESERKAREVALYRQGKFRDVRLAGAAKKVEDVFSQMGENAAQSIQLEKCSGRMAFRSTAFPPKSPKIAWRFSRWRRRRSASAPARGQGEI
jgi:hypothetical protein